MKNKNRIQWLSVISFLLFTGIGIGASREEQGRNAEKYLVLENEMAVFLQARDNIPLVNIAFAVNVGSKDENPGTSGLVHILEHVLLLGETGSHSMEDLYKEMRGRGVRFNAHTGHDMMTFELTLPSQYWEYGLTLLKEKIFNLKFSKEFLEKEKKIIFEEISQHEDDPIRMGTYLALQGLFPNHPYSRPIFGEKQVIEKAGVDEIMNFYREYFLPSNCTLAVVGDFQIGDMEKKTREIFGPIESKIKAKDIRRPVIREMERIKKNVTVERQMDIEQTYLVVGFFAPGSNDDDKIIFDLIDDIFGRGINPLLRRPFFVNNRVIINSVSTRYFPLQYGGAFLIYISMDPRDLKRARYELIKFLGNTGSLNYSIQDYPPDARMVVMDYLETARSHIKYSGEQFKEHGMNAALSFAAYILPRKDKENAKSQEPYLDRIEKIKSPGIRDAASKYLSGEKYVMITINPQSPGNKANKKNEEKEKENP